MPPRRREHALQRDRAGRAGPAPAEPDVAPLTRRTLLRWGALGAVGWLAPGCAERESGSAGARGGAIDAHAHVWTDDVASFPLAPGRRVEDLWPRHFEAEELLEVAGANGVARAVLVAHRTFYGWNNDYAIAASARHPGSFRIVGSLDVTGPDPVAEMRRLRPLGVAGFRISPRERGDAAWLERPEWEPVWRGAAETGQAMCCLVDPALLPSIDAMCARHPDTPVVIDHLGRIGGDGRIRDADVDRLCRLARHPRTAVKVSGFHALGRRQPPYLDLVPLIERALDAFGPERLMWGSDSPYQLSAGQSYASSIELVRSRIPFLSEGDREWILRRTAATVFGFDG